MSDVMTQQTEKADVTLKSLPFIYAKRHGMLVDQLDNGVASIVCREGIKSQSIIELRRYLDLPLTLRQVSSGEFDRLLQKSYEQGSAETMQMAGDMDEELDLFQVAQQMPEPEDLLESEDDAPIIRLINALLTQAIKEGASDIHIEPYENYLVVRFRVDGVLREVLRPKRVLAPLLVSRIKVMARLDIAEKRLPQDGRISLKIAGRAVDVRVSTLPTGQGERVVMRLLDKQAGRLTLEQLGMQTQALIGIERVIHRPHGVLLVTGPTGSGKSTTLYAALMRINDRKRNIMTVEDPIEYSLEGVSQTNVNTKVEMSFARGLRAILRQDPDVVMVGEIRDLVTAEIAVQASLTGHMVMSTLHTNSAVGAVTRLRDMGVEPFLLSSSLLGVLAQRLVRVLCPACKQAYTPSEGECLTLGVDPASPPTIYQPCACDKCNQTGYMGRTGIYELFEVDEQLRIMIHDGASEHAMEAYSHRTASSIYQDGIRRVLSGDTSLEEVLRVTQEG
jgi:general secretion pathway protein E